MSNKIEFFKKVSKIQQELKVPKSRKNTFGNYQYRKAEDIQEAFKNIVMNNDELKCLSLWCSDEVVLIGSRYYVKATTVLSDGEFNLITTAYAREDESKKGMDVAQVTGAASSYARKYALNGMFVLDDSELDPDHVNDNKKIEENKKPEKKSTSVKTENFVQKTIQEAINEISTAQSTEELSSTYRSLPPELKKDALVLDMCKNRKEQLVNQGASA